VNPRFETVSGGHTFNSDLPRILSMAVELRLSRPCGGVPAGQIEYADCVWVCVRKSHPSFSSIRFLYSFRVNYTPRTPSFGFRRPPFMYMVYIVGASIEIHWSRQQGLPFRKGYLTQGANCGTRRASSVF
jgi:hypothetical protein